MIPFFYKRYHKAPLATFVSVLSSLLYLGAVLLSAGYFFNWAGIRDEMKLEESLTAAVVALAVGFILMKWAAWLAKRKYNQLAMQAESTANASR